MKESYIHQVFPLYFILGEYADGDVDIATVEDNTVATVSREHALKLIAQRTEIVDALTSMALAFDAAAPEAFDKFWYGKGESK